VEDLLNKTSVGLAKTSVNNLEGNMERLIKVYAERKRGAVLVSLGTPTRRRKKGIRLFGGDLKGKKERKLPRRKTIGFQGGVYG